MTKEWEEATNERAREMKLNPITGTCSSITPLPYPNNNSRHVGISSEGYSGKGFVQSSK